MDRHCRKLYKGEGMSGVILYSKRQQRIKEESRNFRLRGRTVKAKTYRLKLYIKQAIENDNKRNLVSV